MPGRVTRLVQQTKNTSRVSVYLDGEYGFGLYQDVAFAYGLQVGQTLSAEDERALKAEDRLLGAKSAAIGYLGHRARTETEVRRRLARADFDEGVVDQVVARLYELGYLDDAAYARDYVKSRFRSKGYGPSRLRRDLMRRGVAAPLIDAALAAHLDADETLEAARAQAARRWPRLEKEPDPRKRRRKLSDFLLRRGFTFDTVRQVVDELTRE